MAFLAHYKTHRIYNIPKRRKNKHFFMGNVVFLCTPYKMPDTVWRIAKAQCYY